MREMLYIYIYLDAGCTTYVISEKLHGDGGGTTYIWLAIGHNPRPHHVTRWETAYSQSSRLARPPVIATLFDLIVSLSPWPGVL
jgi:hypothetical protein